MRSTTISLGGGTYMLVALGVGLAVSSWGGVWWWAILLGIFWPVTLAYWLARALHAIAAG
jgi:sterol desaturase/sphingolipid hydroxylase (fatty acid hydroxylase superfamily)